MTWGIVYAYTIYTILSCQERGFYDMHTMPHRFGMFVHWGIYALSEFHEQYRWKLCVSRKE